MVAEERETHAHGHARVEGGERLGRRGPREGEGHGPDEGEEGGGKDEGGAETMAGGARL